MRSTHTRQGKQLFRRRLACALAALSFFCLANRFVVSAQTINVKNFLNPDAPLVREALAEITGTNFTDETEQNPFDTPTTLGGVQVMLGGVAQRLRLVSPTRVIFIVDTRGHSPRNLQLMPKTGDPLTAEVNVVSTWPGILVQSADEIDENAFLPSGLWTTTGISQTTITNDPIPIGHRQQPTRITITGSGWRYATRVRVWLNGLECPVVIAGAATFFPGLDEIVFEIPSLLASGGGGYHLRVTVGDRESNYTRINLQQQ